MNKILLTITLSLVTLLGWAQQPTFTIRYSEPLAVYVFAKNLTVNYGENPFKKRYTQSAYNTEQYNDLIAQLDTLSIEYTYSFSEYPYGSKVPGMTEGLLKKNMIASTTITEFKLRSVGLIPNSSLNQLARILTAFTPIYNELIYTPNKTAFENQLATITTYVTSNNISDYFETGLTFYHSEWDNSIPFEMAFYPLPNSKGFTAEAFYNNAVSAIQTDLKDHTILISVMLHEIFHILYDEQPLAVKKELEIYFNQHPSNCSTYAYLLLNEVLATALGNGYVFEQLNGKPDADEWYNWPYINLMAKQIYPTVLTYIQEKKPIDQQFVDTYIQLYEASYSHWINELDHTLTYRALLSDNSSDFDVFQQAYSYCSVSEFQNPINKENLEQLKSTPLTKVIIVSTNNKAKLALIKETFPELKKWSYHADKEFSHTQFLADKTQLYIINQLKSPTDVLLKLLEPQAH